MMEKLIRLLLILATFFIVAIVISIPIIRKIVAMIIIGVVIIILVIWGFIRIIDLKIGSSLLIWLLAMGLLNGAVALCSEWF